MSKKLFHVVATIDIDMCILAETAEEAKEIGTTEWHSELHNIDPEPDMRAYEITRRSQLEFMADYLDDEVPRGAEAEETVETISEILDKLGIK